MSMKPVSDKVAVSPQISLSLLEGLKSQGYTTVISNRPDHEEPGQPSFDEVRAAARAAGLKAHHIPIRPGQATPADVDAFGKAVEGASGKVLAFCKSGGRSQSLFEASRR